MTLNLNELKRLAEECLNAKTSTAYLSAYPAFAEATMPATILDLIARIEEAETRNALQQRALDAKQAEIDRLMLEYCPNEMTSEQLAEWGKHQRPTANGAGGKNE